MTRALERAKAMAATSMRGGRALADRCPKDGITFHPPSSRCPGRPRSSAKEKTSPPSSMR